MKFILPLFAVLFLHLPVHTNQSALVIVPVADLVGAPIQTFQLGKTIKESYAKINICGGTPTPTQGSPRIHQLLLHELVEIVSEDGDEVCIIIPQIFFITHSLHKPQAMYWTLKKNLLTLKKLNETEREKIPASPSYKTPKAITQVQNTIVIFKPFYDPVTQQTLSAGTRFIIDMSKTFEHYFSAFVFDRKTSSFKTTLIPKKIAMTIQKHTVHDSITCFVKLLQQWAHCINGPIPYVWGGCSFTHCCNHEFVERKKKLITGAQISVFERPDCTEKPLSGLDCAGLITRAAHICGIPYYFKNTYTLAHYLKSLSIDQHLQEGDLIWIPGHVMIVSDLANNKIIEARGYSSNYGIVHEITLDQMFKDINTYDDLIHAYRHQTPLMRLNKEGDEVEEIKRYKILKLSSAWDHTSY
jgi:cell wall-associated NlpC family hydrolase